MPDSVHHKKAGWHPLGVLGCREEVLSTLFGMFMSVFQPRAILVASVRTME